MGSIHEKSRGRNSRAIIPLIRKEPLRKDLKEEYADVAVRSYSPVPPPPFTPSPMVHGLGRSSLDFQRQFFSVLGVDTVFG